MIFSVRIIARALTEINGALSPIKLGWRLD